MSKSLRWGLVLVMIGVVTNNISYLHDVIVDENGGMIFLGWHAVAGIIVSLMIIGIGAWLIVRRPVPRRDGLTRAAQVRKKWTENSRFSSVHDSTGVKPAARPSAWNSSSAYL